ncbi:hypothetical protein CYMTET_33420, partial [Cymbomonas tetramitiformis]
EGADSVKIIEKLRSIGLTSPEVDLAVHRNPLLLSYRFEEDVLPRINYLQYLKTKGIFDEGETYQQFVLRQPQFLEMQFQEIFSDERYIAVNKPFDTRHDTPRGWGRPRYTLRYEGDISAEEFLERTPRADLSQIRAAPCLDSGKWS